MSDVMMAVAAKGARTQDHLTAASAPLPRGVTMSELATPSTDGSVETPVELSEKAVLAAARAMSGLSDLREIGCADRLQRLLRHMDQDMALTSRGRQMALATVSDLVSQRAQLLADRERYPEIQRERIERPLIIAGSGRSGTTLLHTLLSKDPNNRVPKWWETRYTSPPPGVSPANDPRIEKADLEIADVLVMVPALRQAHPYFDEGGQSAVECEGIVALDLRSYRRTIYFRVPGTVSYDMSDDPVGLYEFHRQVLQSLQWNMPRRRWALKGVAHHTRLEALKAVYPDAIVIWLHRDPQKTVPSMMELTRLHDEGITGRPIDRRAIGRKLMEGQLSMLEAGMASPMIGHPDVFCLRYADFHADPVGQIESIYARYELPFDATTAAAMQNWLDDPQNKGDRYGKFHYSLESFGISREELEERVSAYRDRFGIPFENDSK
jgi:hypothetical protein